MKRHPIKLTLYILIALPLVLLLLFAFNYAFCPVYRFPEPQAFSGKSWYNPYQDQKYNWYKANFHGHSRQWLGLTNGADSIERIRDYYHQMGYDIVGISDYQHISIFEDTPTRQQLPAYEHGFNPTKTHQLALGARKVIWLDYPFGQNSHHRQHIIDTLQKHSEFVILAHPSLLDGYRPEDISRITGYDGFEALNHYRYSLELWDTALSAGRAVWCFGGDDCHNIAWKNETGVRWTMVQAKSKKVRHVLNALRKGSHYAVAGRDGILTNRLKSLEVNDNLLTVTVISPAEKMRFIGQDGKLRKEVVNTATAEYRLTDADTYVRVEILSSGTDIYLNPVIRWDGKTLPRPKAQINYMATWTQRIVVILLLIFIILIIIRFRKKSSLPK